MHVRFLAIGLVLAVTAYAKRAPQRVCCQQASLFTMMDVSACTAFGGVTASVDHCLDAEDKKVCCHAGNGYEWNRNCPSDKQVPPEKNCLTWLTPSCCQDPQGVPEIVTYYDCTQWAKGAPPFLSDLSYCLNAARPVCCDKEIQESHYQVWTRSDLCNGPGQQVLNKSYSDCLKPSSDEDD